MDDTLLREVLLVKAIEEVDTSGRILPRADREAATREALREVDAGSGAAPREAGGIERFLAARTRRLFPPLAERLPALASVASLDGVAWWLVAGVLAAAFVGGFSLSALDASKRIDILSMPFLGLVLWNFAVYLALVAHRLWPGRRRGQRGEGGRNEGGWLEHQAARFGRLLVRAPGAGSALPGDTLTRFASGLGQAFAARLASDVERLLHVAAATLAVGLVAGIYLRGTVLQYLAGWESTFLDAAQVRRLIDVLFAPAALFTGVPLPGSSVEVEALNWSHGGVPAAPWLHLIATTLVVCVVLPRALLAGSARLRSARLAHDAALPSPLVEYARDLMDGGAVASASRPTRASTVNLSLISHTNVGKTTLARTLLYRDVGEVRDAEHVTTQAIAYELVVSDAGDLLQLWDTPGFADSVRLAARLEQGGAIGWFLSQVWDRFTDRAFHLSQRAVANVREIADVSLYLVDARRGPDALADLDAEMRILGWLGRPVIVLVNQLGEPLPAAREREETERWATRLACYPWVCATLPFDAFARCWVQEEVLIDAIGAALPASRAAAWSRLANAWRHRNEARFQACVDALVDHLASAAVDVEPVAARGLAATARGWIGRPGNGTEAQAPFDAAARVLAARAAASLREATRRLLALHRLGGSVAEEIDARVASHFSIATAVDAGKAGLLGAAMSGALGGLAADLAAGGLTLGAGALIGALLGAAGASGLARAYNQIRGAERSIVRFSPELLEDLTVAAALRYLAIAHFGRGRGDYVASESSPHWDGVVRGAIARHRSRWHDAWEACTREEAADAVRDRLRPLCAELLREILQDLYPAASLRLDAPGEPQQA